MTSKSATPLSSTQIEMISGVSAGLISTLITHPLDLVKIRLQVSNYNLRTIFNHITNKPDYLKQFYQGLTPNLIGNASSWSLYFTLYEYFKTYNIRNDSFIDQSKKNDHILRFFTASSISGLITSVTTNPIWFLKTRLISENNPYTSLHQSILYIYRTEGLKSFWKGLVPSLFPVFQNSLQFTVYESLKKWVILNEDDQHMGNYVTLSTISKFSTMIVMYPFQVLRSNLQKIDGRNITFELRKLWENKSFYRGFTIAVVKSVPTTSIILVSYETIKNNLTRSAPNDKGRDGNI
ncbi:mitochondrial nicotinamide adenine dinucleotide transporter 2 [[Candida] jaroonii]|uniref:Mitochondrial nicotinamide adenine dinucleotide transporter 2 n=1 Tax=[Candida] jaroonii TaxID=467808 RepID=A0ACA9YBM2_9ASCO|nr:mitochondrial nicotinamide adenine dinucleotide transporter 2 [[Candida] jaroonii]